jgi:hypothetical protein
MPKHRPLRDDDYGQAAADAGLEDELDEELEQRCTVCNVTRARHPASLTFYPATNPLSSSGKSSPSTADDVTHSTR